MDEPIINDSLKSSDRLKQEANYLAYCNKRFKGVYIVKNELSHMSCIIILLQENNVLELK